MSDYRRFLLPGGTYFFTLVAYQRRPRFAQPSDVQRLRDAVAFVQREQPFRFLAAVILPDHMHFIWTLPPSDSDYSRRIGRMKVHFARGLVRGQCPPDVDYVDFTRSCDASVGSEIGVSPSRRKHRDADVWQRRVWEHTIDEEGELQALLDYIHYNPVKHGLAACPHAWAASSFPDGLPADFMTDPGDAVASESGPRRATSPTLRGS
jgi:putative transposase